MPNRFAYIYTALLATIVALTLAGCNGTKYVDDGDYLLTGTGITCDNPHINISSLAPYMRQRPNSRWLANHLDDVGVILVHLDFGHFHQQAIVIRVPYFPFGSGGINKQIFVHI